MSLCDKKDKYESIKEWRITFDSITDLVSILDMECKIVTANKAFADAFSKRPEELVGMQCCELVHNTNESPENCPLRKTLSTGKPAKEEIYNDLLKKHLEISTFPVFGDKGEIIEVVHFARDITERKLMEETLRNSETMFKSIATAVPVGLSIASNRKTLWMNDYFLQIIGREKEEVVGKDSRIFYENDEGYDLVGNQIYRELKEKGKAEIEVNWKHKDGRILNILLTGVALDKQDLSRGIVFAALNITKRKQAQEELRWKTTFLESQTEASLDGQLVVDGNGQIVLINKRLIDLFEIPEHITKDKNDKVLLEYIVSRTKYPEQFLERAKYLYAHQDETSRDELEFKDGMVFDRYSSPVIDKDGKYFGRSWMFRDITARKRAENALRESNESLIIATARAREMAAKAEKANIAKSEFLATMSHELRTPLNSIIGFSEILKDELVDEQKKHIEMVYNSGKHLLRLLGDILDLSKIEAEKIDVAAERCSPREITAKVESMMRPLAAEKGLAFTIHEKGVVAANIVTDSVHLEQCLINLVDNAIKFTEHGQVYVNISMEDRGGKSFICFEVGDTGIGIDPEFHEKIFDFFVQEDGSTSRKYGGAGLGLTISKKLAELLGGKITVTSEKGKGSVFVLAVPANTETADSIVSVK